MLKYNARQAKVKTIQTIEIVKMIDSAIEDSIDKGLYSAEIPTTDRSQDFIDRAKAILNIEGYQKVSEVEYLSNNAKGISFNWKDL